MADTPVQSQPSAIFQRPVKDVQNVFGRPERTQWEDSSSRIDANSDMRPKTFDAPFRRPYSGPLPSFNAFVASSGQMVGETTRISRIETNEIEQTVPFYERYWPILQGQPIQPSIGDIDSDPRYMMQNTRNVAQYQKLSDLPGAATVKTVHPNYGIQK